MQTQTHTGAGAERRGLTVDVQHMKEQKLHKDNRWVQGFCLEGVKRALRNDGYSKYIKF